MLFISEIGMNELLDVRDIQGEVPWSANFLLKAMEIQRALAIKIFPYDYSVVWLEFLAIVVRVNVAKKLQCHKSYGVDEIDFLD